VPPTSKSWLRHCVRATIRPLRSTNIHSIRAVFVSPNPSAADLRCVAGHAGSGSNLAQLITLSGAALYAWSVSEKKKHTRRSLRQCCGADRTPTTTTTTTTTIYTPDSGLRWWCYFRRTNFYRAMLCIRGTSHGPVSAGLSVTSRCSIETDERIELAFGM